MIKACKPKNVVLRYKIMSKCVEGDSCLQKPTGIRRHRLRTLFGGGLMERWLVVLGVACFSLLFGIVYAGMGWMKKRACQGEDIRSQE